ncbi:MAG: glycine cleavage system protein GcvH [Acidimicrobiia bacterium]
MSNVPSELRYTREHEWARLESDGSITVGVTDYAQDQLGDIVFLDLPDVGDSVTGGEPLGEIESTKSVSDIYSPVTGTVSEVNLEARENPAVINQDPYGEGWMLRLTPDDPAEYDGLLTPEEYERLTAEEEGES